MNDPQRGVRTYLDKTVGCNPTQRADFGYDTVDQLTSEVLSEGGTPQWSKSFAYDPMGNRTTSQSVTSSDTVDNTYTSNKLNQVTALLANWSGGANTLASSLLYDQSGNLTKWTSTGTGEATPAHTEYVYDDSERLIAVIKKNPTTQANLSKSEFVYDGGSRLRISREYTWDDDAWVLVPNSEKRRIYDGMDVIQERDGNNAVNATYTRDGNIGGILAKRDAQEDDYFFHYDGSGNVVGLTDEAQNTVAEYVYDAYGNLLSSSGAQASNNSYRYSTKEYFTHAGLYNYGVRFYSSGLGRWINRDPIAEAGGLNLYGFNHNSPPNYVDPYGRVPVVVAVAAVWAVVEVAGTLYDAYTTVKTLYDPCASNFTKATTSGLFIAGIYSPGFGGPAIYRNADKVVDVLKAGDAGSFRALDRLAVRGDDLTPHHMPQAALNHTSRADGGALAMTHAEHELTRTYKGAGRRTAREDAEPRSHPKTLFKQIRAQAM